MSGQGFYRVLTTPSQRDSPYEENIPCMIATTASMQAVQMTRENHSRNNASLTFCCTVKQARTLLLLVKNAMQLCKQQA